METSEPIPFEQTLPKPEKAEDRETLPPPVDAKSAKQSPEAGNVEEPIVLKEGEFVAEAVGKRPEAVYAHVEAAAKRGEAQEGAYERRHEIKDEATQPMVPVGSVVADLSTSQPAMAKASQYAAKPPAVPPPLPGALPEATPVTPATMLILYRRSMLVGFAAALALIAIFVIARVIAG